MIQNNKKVVDKRFEVCYYNLRAWESSNRFRWNGKI